MKARAHPIIVFGLAVTLAANPALAQAPSDTLGRLFFPPERRTQLERQRQLNLKQIQELEGETLSLGGIVRRSSGRSTTWINGIAQHDNAAPTGILVVPSSGDTARAVLSAGRDEPVSLKVGESVNRSTREKQDGLAGGQVVVKRQAGIAPRQDGSKTRSTAPSR